MTLERDNLLEWIRDLATPIDFETLIADGILTQQGDRYSVTNIHHLPASARRKIVEMETDTRKPGVLVKFESEKPYQAMLAQWERSDATTDVIL